MHRLQCETKIFFNWPTSYLSHYPPLKGAIWGEYNNCNLNKPSIKSLLKAFRQDIHFCMDLCFINLAVKCR